MIFVDSGAWIAVLNPKDRHHEEANATFAGLHRHMTLVTTDYVIDETATRLRYDTNHALAVKFLDAIEAFEMSGDLTVMAITAEVFKEAKALFRQRNSPRLRLSFTDCTSFVVCWSDVRITKAFAFDEDFPKMGIPLQR